MRMKVLSSVAMLAMVAALNVGVSAQGAPGGAPAAGAPPAQGGAPGGGGQGRGGGGGRGGGRGGFNLPPLLMETDAFPDGGIVPAKYTSAGGSTLPGFKISGAPATAVSYAVIFHDIDVSLGGGTDDVLHWMAWNIPVSANGWPEGSLPAGSVTGQNMTRQASYFGPGAPAGPRYHHYVFELYALSSNLDIPATATRAELLAAMAGKVVAKSAYVGRFRGEAGAAPAGGGRPGGPPPAGGAAPPAPGGGRGN